MDRAIMTNLLTNYSLTVTKIIFFCLVLTSCESDKFRVDISDIQLDIEVKRFEVDLFRKEYATLEEKTDFLKNEYGDFYQFFCEQAIRVGRISDDDHIKDLNSFVTDPYITELNMDVEAEYADFTEIESRIVDDFKRYKFHFKESEIPDIYTFVSGFNYSIIRTENSIGIGLDRYLDTAKSYYSRLGYPAYMIRKMRKKFIEVDVMSSWLKTEYPIDELEKNLLEKIIHEGKIAYLLDGLVVNEHDSIKFGYTPVQLEWCENNESRIWATLIENEVLYTSDYDVSRRYLGEAPFTMDMTKDSPGRICAWVGLQIIRKYMDRNSEMSMKELMEQSDSQKILSDSRYKPKI
ncbi:MAG: hypothetical protein HRT72_02500 [Flavobacteriales bacterium]|nr:hypothetical protein [Flavobacteriales bacterium]